MIITNVLSGGTFKENVIVVSSRTLHLVKERIIVIYSDMHDWTCILSDKDKKDDSKDKEEAECQSPFTSPMKKDGPDI